MGLDMDSSLMLRRLLTWKGEESLKMGFFGDLSGDFNWTLLNLRGMGFAESICLLSVTIKSDSMIDGLTILTW
jgi:hypothetical protein